MANGARFNVMFYEVDDFAIVGLHAGGPDLNRNVLRRHYRDILLPHVLQSQGIAALTSGPGVPTLEQVGTRVDHLLAPEAARLRRLQHEWNRSPQKDFLGYPSVHLLGQKVDAWGLTSRDEK